MLCYYQAVSNYSETLGIDVKPQQEVTLRLYRELLDPNNEPVLDNDKIWEEVCLGADITRQGEKRDALDE